MGFMQSLNSRCDSALTPAGGRLAVQWNRELGSRSKRSAATALIGREK